MGRLETMRLILRKPQEADAEAITEICNSNFVQRHNEMKPKSLEVMRSKIEENKNKALVLEKKFDHSIIGVVAYDGEKEDRKVTSYDLSYYLAEEESRKGYMSEALTAVIRHLFIKGAQTIYATTSEENKASCALLDGLGFSQDKILDGDCTYSIENN